MSHYTVAIFHRPDQDIDELLAPFSEELKVDPYIVFSRSEAIAKARERYEVCKDKTDDECYAFMADGYQTDDEGNLLSTYNPNSKWDWYTEGGRWSGMLRDKKTGCETDEGRVGDLEFGLDQEEYDYALRFWDVVVDHKPHKPDEEYHTIYKEEYYKEYYGDRDTYARHCAQFSTFAVLTPDGVWHEKGEMGWFGCSSETPEEARDWEDHYEERFLKTADPDWILTIVDCHI